MFYQIDRRLGLMVQIPLVQGIAQHAFPVKAFACSSE